MTVTELSTVLANIDPLELITGGAPLDEYSLEANEILNLLKTVSPDTKVESIVDHVFSQWFWPGCLTPEHIIQIASQIKEKI